MNCAQKSVQKVYKHFSNYCSYTASLIIDKILWYVVSNLEQ